MGIKPDWTKEEITFLENNWGHRRFEYIAEKLGRTVSGIKNKAVRLKLGDSRSTGHYITLNQFAQAIGVDARIIKGTWVKNGFKLKNYKVEVRTVRRVDIDYFWKWAAENKGIVNLARMEENILGAEPEWVKEKRKADRMDPSRVAHNRKWTKYEDEKLISLCKTYKYTYRELSEILNRTEKAIRTRIYDLAIPHRPIPLDNHVKWTNEEKVKLKELLEKGYSHQSISKILNKSALSIAERAV